MYKNRGVLTQRNISTLFTFGAPSVFCESPSADEQDDGKAAEEEGNNRRPAAGNASTTALALSALTSNQVQKLCFTSSTSRVLIF